MRQSLFVRMQGDHRLTHQEEREEEGQDDAATISHGVPIHHTQPRMSFGLHIECHLIQTECRVGNVCDRCKWPILVFAVAVVHLCNILLVSNQINKHTLTSCFTRLVAAALGVVVVV